MGTRADFYVGKGGDAEWLGSIAWDGYRDGIDNSVLSATSEEEYRAALTNFANRRDWTAPDQGWPWPWDDSGTTDCSYWFFEGRVWDAVSDPPYYAPCDEPQPEDIRPDDAQEVVFPDMSARKNVTFGPRSGVIVFGG